MNKIIGLNPATHVEEFFGLVKPMTTILFKSKGSKTISYKVDEKGIKKTYLPKISGGKWGNQNLVNIFDYLWYSLAATALFPYLVLHKKILVHGPPFFQAHLVPLLRLFGREVYSIVIDEQLPIKNINIFKKIYYKFAGLLEFINIKFSTKAFATSKHLYNKYKKYKKQVYYTPNGADVDTIDKIKAKRKFKEFTISYLGGFEEWRGIDMLIKAFLSLKQKGIKAKLLIMGGGPDFEITKKTAGNDKDIVFTGYISHDEAVSYCKGSDILVMPSRNCLASQTISSIKCFEYVACGVPSIVTDSGEHAYWTKKFGAGLIVKDNAESLKEGILKIYKDKELYNKLKENCKKHQKDVDYKTFKKPFVDEVLGK